MRTGTSASRIAAAVIAALMATGLAFGQQTTFNCDPGTDFTKFETSTWVAIETAQHPDQITGCGGGTATETIDPSSNPNKNDQHLQKALTKLLESYAPPVSK